MKGCEVYFQRRFHGRRRCRIVRSLMAYTGRLLPKGALTLLRLTLTLTDKRSLGEVHERDWKALEKRGKSVYHQTRFRAVEKAIDINVLVYGDFFILKDSAVKKDAKFLKLGMWKGYHLLIEGYFFCQKWYISGTQRQFSVKYLEEG